MTQQIYDSLTPYKRKQLYENCEKNNLRFDKTKVWAERWVCRKHGCMLVAKEEAWCSDLCCLRCPKRVRCCNCGDCDDDCDYREVTTKITRVTVYFE